MDEEGAHNLAPAGGGNFVVPLFIIFGVIGARNCARIMHPASANSAARDAHVDILARSRNIQFWNGTSPERGLYHFALS
jgi:hypothetical protein